MFATLAKQLLVQSAFVALRDLTTEQGRNPRRGLGCSCLSFPVLIFALSLLLRCALLLISCAFSLYFWKVNAVISTIVLVVAFGTIPFYSPFVL